LEDSDSDCLFRNFALMATTDPFVKNFLYKISKMGQYFKTLLMIDVVKVFGAS
jgi:hypothetical protein